MQNELFQPTETRQYFTYLGYKFYPIRQFTEKESSLGLKLPLSRLEKPKLSFKDNQFDYDCFYKSAKEVGADKIDIFQMSDKTLVVPCGRYLDEYQIQKLDKCFNQHKDRLEDWHKITIFTS